MAWLEKLPRTVFFCLFVFLATVIPSILAFPLLLAARRAETRGFNAGKAGDVLKRLAVAEAHFRGLDADANGVEDFWTGDVAGLFSLGLIDRSLAMADLRPMFPLGPRPVPLNGYYFMALELDGSVDPPEPYRQETDAASGKVHHRSRFGFIAVPARPESAGTPLLIINENNSLWAWRGDWVPTSRWPSDAELRLQWSRFG